MLPLRKRISCDGDVIKHVMYMVGRGTSKCYALFLSSIFLFVIYNYAYTPSLKLCSFVAGTLGVASSAMGQQGKEKEEQKEAQKLDRTGGQ